MIFLITLIIILFPIGILLRKKFPNLCALCFATSGAWALGLAYFLISSSNAVIVDDLSLGILIGASIVGSMYYLSSKAPEKYDLFKLPYFLSLFVFAYFILTRQINITLLIGTGVLWVIFIFLHLSKNNKYLRGGIKNIIECCKNW